MTMSNEITTEVLAEAVAATKKRVQDTIPGQSIELNIGGKKTEYILINTAASGDGNQMNAMAFAPVGADGKPDYNNVAVVYAGTNAVGLKHDDVGDSGLLTALEARGGGLSSEYKLAEDFLSDTQRIVAANGGTITDVAGFSQAGGYMMKMAAEHGQQYGFKTTSFDDWGHNQYGTLTPNEQKWLDQNPQMLIRYQNESWAKTWSDRDSEHGTVIRTEWGEHDTLKDFFNGDALDLDALASRGIFVDGMSEAQVKKAAEVWAKNNGDWNPFTNDEKEAANKVKEYLEKYGSYGDGSGLPGAGDHGGDAWSGLTNFADNLAAQLSNLANGIAFGAGAGKWGMDIQQVRQLAHQFNQKAVELDGILGQLTGLLNSSPWQGPDAAQFRGQWSGPYSAAIRQASAALRTAAQQAQQNANQQEQASQS